MVLQEPLQSTATDIYNEICELHFQINHLMKMKKQGIVNGVDAVIHELTKKEYKLKEKEVLKVHTNAITEITIKVNGQEVKRWQTRCDGSRPRCSSYDALIDKLYDHYFGRTVVTNYSFKAIFEAALDEKIRTERPKQKTINDYHVSYKAFITEEFGAKDIRMIKPSELKEYIQSVSHQVGPTKKRFYKFKGVLNLVFNYACDPERRLIDVNPVPAKNKAYEKNFAPTSNKPEDKAFQPREIELIRDYLWKRVNEMRYDVNGYAILFSSETGLREGEIPSLKWSDIEGNAIHIHSQQNDERRDGVKVYYYNPTTKNEKGVSNNGRYIPLTNRISHILAELKAKQKALGIDSEWVFCKEDGTWTTTAAYYEALYKVTHKLGLRLSNNHAFRMALNSYVYVPMGLPVTERAKILGHSVDTNLRHYTFARTEDYISELCDKINAFDDKTRDYPEDNEVCTSRYLKVIPFSAKEKSPQTANLKALI